MFLNLENIEIQHLICASPFIVQYIIKEVMQGLFEWKDLSPIGMSWWREGKVKHWGEPTPITKQRQSAFLTVTILSICLETTQ